MRLPSPLVQKKRSQCQATVFYPSLSDVSMLLSLSLKLPEISESIPDELAKLVP